MRFGNSFIEMRAGIVVAVGLSVIFALPAHGIGGNVSRTASALQSEQRPQPPAAADAACRDRNALDEYVWSITPYTWVDISGLGAALTPGDQSNQGPFALGFTFPFYENTYTSVRVCTNGFLIFGGSTTTAYTNTALPNTTIPNNVIYPFWDDLDAGDAARPTGEIRYYSDVANQRFIVSWIDVPHYYSNGSANHSYTFQCLLYASGNIVFQYHTVQTDTIPGDTSCTVGIENSTGTQAVQVCFNGNGTTPASGRSILIGQPNGMPNPVTNLTGAYSAPNVVLSWIDPTRDTNGNLITVTNVEVWFGAALTGQLLATVAPGVQTYTHGSAPTGFITYTVRPYCNPYWGAPTAISVAAGSSGYMNNFEVDNGQWVPTPPTDGWSWGTPTNTSAPPPHSGTKYWGTGVTANYISNAWWKLDLDTTLVVASPTATVEFWYRFDTELNYDGCNFKASVDNGMTWTVLTPTEGAYTVTAAHVANVYLAGQPLWSGHSQTAWEHAVIPIGQFVGQAPDFRFEFASDPIVASYSGFFFDDMVMTGMRPPSAVSGVVRAHVSALPIAGARIWANGQLDTVTTDSTGNYLLPLDAGTYSITFDHRHYCDSTHNNVVVQAGLVTTCNAVLRRPQAQINRTSVTLVTFPGVIVTDTFRISNNGGLCPLDFAITDTSGWLSATPARGTVNPNQYVVITVEADAPVMIGEYTSSLTIVYNALGSPSTLHVDLAIIDAADDPNVIPAGFAYNQNYPNPFNAQTTLCFDVPQLNRVQITIYTILGQEIAHPVDQVYSPGRYRVPYDASALPSGVYLVKMSAASYSQIGKMMLIK